MENRLSVTLRKARLIATYVVDRIIQLFSCQSLAWFSHALDRVE